MRTLLLLMLAVLLPSGAVSAAPTSNTTHAPGDLARDRLQDFTKLLDAPDQLVLVQPDQSRTVLSEAQAKIAAALVRDLVLDDALYVEDAPQGQSRVTETVTLEKGGLPRLTIAIDRDRSSLSVYQFYGGGSVTANYLPVLPKVVRLLQALDPTDHSLSAFHPLPSPVIAVKGIPASALARIATVEPGMARADVLRVFTTEGGISTTYWNHYVYRDYSLPIAERSGGLVTVIGELVKVNIDFAPRDADIVWLNGRGFWLHQSDYRSHPGQPRLKGQPDDIILRVSAPYLEFSIAD